MNKKILLKTNSTWDKTKYSELEIKEPEITVLKISLDIGEKLNMHKHDLINIAYLQKGTLTITTDNNEQITLQEGECLPELVGKYHFGQNTGNKPVELIVFYIGEINSKLSVDK